ncbi:hypothetical protein KL949_001742 [Ogataea haglerorum]|nr:hypothetical protein KL913_001384 [Ogataea haglerorum]KAG7720870.1 hypothetical protein KL949_001742 [Ogataea haglerorum]KAG7770680.1 hypothetical protein KL931_001502 [Ogataea haglerorum]
MSQPTAPQITKTYARRLYALAYSPAFKDYTEVLDSYMDHWLEDVEHIVPEVKTLRMRDIRDSLTRPVVDASLFVDRNMHALSVAMNQRVLEPARKTASDFRKAYAPLYDTQGRALLRSQLDPVFRPLNERLARLVGDDAGTEYSSELTHSLRLLYGVAEQTRPRIANSVVRSRQLPRQVASHLNEVYEANKSKRGEGRLIVMIASMDTVRDLLNEGYNVVSPGKEQAEPEEAEPERAEPEQPEQH